MNVNITMNDISININNHISSIRDGIVIYIISNPRTDVSLNSLDRNHADKKAFFTLDWLEHAARNILPF